MWNWQYETVADFFLIRTGGEKKHRVVDEAEEKEEEEEGVGGRRATYFIKSVNWIGRKIDAGVGRSAC